MSAHGQQKNQCTDFGCSDGPFSAAAAKAKHRTAKQAAATMSGTVSQPEGNKAMPCASVSKPLPSFTTRPSLSCPLHAHVPGAGAVVPNMPRRAAASCRPLRDSTCSGDREIVSCAAARKL